MNYLAKDSTGQTWILGDHGDIIAASETAVDISDDEIVSVFSEAQQNPDSIELATELLEALRHLTFTARTFRDVPPEEQMWVSSDEEALNLALEAINKATGETA